MESSKITIFVCADLHAYDASSEHFKDEKPSWFDISAVGNKSACPATQLIELFASGGMTADIAICVGDLGDKAHPASTNVAWRAFNEMAAKLSAKHVIATSGNHDLDSRHKYNDFDAKGYLQTLTPLFPLNDLQKFDQYWSRHFAVMEDEFIRIITLNSAAYHGTNDEHQHGRISKNTLAALTNLLKDPALNRLINVLVCHHPPHRPPELEQGQEDSMKLGDDLIKALDQESDAQWLIIHGHKHFPALQYAHGSGDSPVILSSGSMSAVPYLEYGKNGKNQVHFIEFDTATIASNGLAGIVRTLEWTSSTGWVPSDGLGGLAATSGFGNRESSASNATLIAAEVQGKITWTEIIERLPKIQYITRDSLSKVLELLKSNHGVRIGYNENREPDELIREQ